MNYLHVLLITISLVLLTNNLLVADVLDVPEGYDTIQEAIDASEDGDTVLVQPGEYVENIDFDGKAITLASLLLTTGNVAYIDSTIIDGDGDGSVVLFNSGEDEESILIGFTITNGEADNGGGIHSDNSGPTLKNLLVTDCIADMYGGGIYGSGSTMTLTDVSLIGNSVDIMGGAFGCVSSSDIVWKGGTVMNNEGGSIAGISIRWSSAVVSNLLVKDNGPGTQVSAFEVFAWNDDSVDLRNLTVIGDGEVGIGVNCEDAGVLMRNLIVQGHRNDNVHSNQNNLIYSCVEDEPDRNNCIDEDPCFVDPDNGDYTLAEDSPCIDTGDPDSPEDPDGTRADMGAFPFIAGAALQGFVYDASDDEPVQGARLTTSNGKITITDSTGYWIFSPFPVTEFDLTASAPGYNDSTLFGLETAEEETLDVVFGLLRPEMALSTDLIEETLQPGEFISVDFSIRNPGNGRLDWSLEKLPPEGESVEPWGDMFSLPVEEVVNDGRLEGAVYADGRYFVSGRNSDGDEHLVYIITEDGELETSFPQPNPEDRSGMKDLAWDPEAELLWGGVDQIMYAFSPEGDSITSFEVDLGGRSSIQAVAWDNARELLWIAGIVTDIFGYTPEGERIATIERGDFRNYGLAFWDAEEDRSSLYAMHTDNDGQFIYKTDPDSGNWYAETEIELHDGESLGGIFITEEFAPLTSTFLSLVDSPEGDHIRTWLLAADMSWVQVDPLNGLIDPESEQPVEVLLNATELDTGAYEMVIRIRHNAAGGFAVVNIELTVEEEIEDYVLEQSMPIPGEFGIISSYPNPFNSMLNMQYYLPQNGFIQLNMYDLSGRETALIDFGYRKSGSHRSTFDASALPTGIYFLKLKSGKKIASHRVLLLK